MHGGIVPATTAFLREIEVWLREEEAAYDAAEARQAEDWSREIVFPTRGFFCNWNLVLRSFEDDPINVHVLVADGQVVGFVDQMDILEVRPDVRHLGYGRRLAEFMLDKAAADGMSVAEIAIAPNSAIPFWRSLGFTVIEGRIGRGGGVYAFKRLPRRFELPPGPPAAYRIYFFPEERRHDPSVRPYATFEGHGVRREDSRLMLPERAYAFDEAGTASPDDIVQVEVDGVILVEAKVKYPEAARVGVARDASQLYYIDEIALSRN